MRFAIWHLETGNMIGDFATEAAALAAAREEIQANGSPEALVLQREGADSDPEFMASGPALATRAFRAGRSLVLPDRSATGT